MLYRFFLNAVFAFSVLLSTIDAPAEIRDSQYQSTQDTFNELLAIDGLVEEWHRLGVDVIVNRHTDPAKRQGKKPTSRLVVWALEDFPLSKKFKDVYNYNGVEEWMREFEKGAIGATIAVQAAGPGTLSEPTTLGQLKELTSNVHPSKWVFLAFAREDAGTASSVKRSLETCDFRVFTYIENSSATPRAPPAELGRFFRRAGLRLVLDSENARRSKGVNFEAYYAQEGVAIYRPQLPLTTETAGIADLLRDWFRSVEKRDTFAESDILDIMNQSLNRMTGSTSKHESIMFGSVIDTDKPLTPDTNKPVWHFLPSENGEWSAIAATTDPESRTLELVDVRPPSDNLWQLLEAVISRESIERDSKLLIKGNDFQAGISYDLPTGEYFVELLPGDPEKAPERRHAIREARTGSFTEALSFLAGQVHSAVPTIPFLQRREERFIRAACREDKGYMVRYCDLSLDSPFFEAEDEFMRRRLLEGMETLNSYFHSRIDAGHPDARDRARRGEFWTGELIEHLDRRKDLPSKHYRYAHRKVREVVQSDVVGSHEGRIPAALLPAMESLKATMASSTAERVDKWERPIHGRGRSPARDIKEGIKTRTGRVKRR